MQRSQDNLHPVQVWVGQLPIPRSGLRSCLHSQGILGRKLDRVAPMQQAIPVLSPPHCNIYSKPNFTSSWLLYLPIIGYKNWLEFEICDGGNNSSKTQFPSSNSFSKIIETTIILVLPDWGRYRTVSWPGPNTSEGRALFCPLPRLLRGSQGKPARY